MKRSDFLQIRPDEQKSLIRHGIVLKFAHPLNRFRVNKKYIKFIVRLNYENQNEGHYIPFNFSFIV